MSGKFATDLDAYVYGMTLDGTCEEIGSVQFAGWAALVPFEERDGFRFELDPPFAEMLQQYRGAIVSESSQGFVDVTYFEDWDGFDAEWQALTPVLEEDFEEDEI